MKDKLEIKKGVQMMNLVLDVAMCEICDNYTPRVYVEDFKQECCEICFEAYGECN